MLAGARRADRDDRARPARRRRRLPQPRPARQDHDDARHHLRRPRVPRHRRRLVRGRARRLRLRVPADQGALRAPGGPPADRPRDVHRRSRRRSPATHHSVTDAYNNPKPLRGDIPILIGGSGERKTLRMVAQYADGCNLFGDPDRAKHLLGVLEGHCENVGRDSAEITKTSMMTLAIGETEAAVKAKLDAMRAAGFPEERIAATTGGTPEQVLERRPRLPRRRHRGRDLLDARRPRPGGRDAGRRDPRSGLQPRPLATTRASRAGRRGSRRRPCSSS